MDAWHKGREALGPAERALDSCPFAAVGAWLGFERG
jgi:hypothetical protein